MGGEGLAPSDPELIGRMFGIRMGGGRQVEGGGGVMVIGEVTLQERGILSSGLILVGYEVDYIVEYS